MLAKTLLSLSLVLPLAAADTPTITDKGQTPEEALQRMRTPDGFSIDLIAGEPSVVQPIAMCFDARGRLWVAEGLTYPKRAPEGQGEDRILIFEDTDGDGVFDSRKVFAEHLNLISGLELGFGGVYVGAAPYLLFIPDKDGDDKPDGPPQVLLDGFGYQDTHETLNSFIWGPDGWLWGCHGIFTRSAVGKPGTPDDQRVPLDAGIWRFDPRSGKFEVVAHGTSNPWGLDFNDWGDAFIEACVIPHLWHMIPGGHYQRQAGSDANPYIYDPIPTIADHLHYTGNIADHAHWNGREGGPEPESVSAAGGGHAHSGFAICLSDAFPAEFRNTALFFNIHGHRMNHDLLVRNGSGWTGKHGQDLLMTYDQWFLGVSIRPGPDGALYFNDWYDATSCHRPDPERWDRSNGRLYRMRHGDLKPWKDDLTQWSDLRLAQAQAGHNEWELRMARKVLEERVAAGKTLAPEALSSLRDTFGHHPDETRKLRALWTLRACGQLRDDDLSPFLAGSSSLAAWTIRIATEDDHLRLFGAISAVAEKATAPVVQLALCSAMQRVDEETALRIAKALPPLDPRDQNLYRMFWFGIERLAPKHPAEILQIALGAEDERLLDWTARRLEGPEALDQLFTAFGTVGSQPDRQRWLLKAIAGRLEHNAGEKISPANAAILASLDIPGDTTARDLAARAGDPTATERLWVIALDAKAPAADRIEALKILATSKAADSQERWKQLLPDPAVQLDVMDLKPALLDLPEAETAISGLSVEQKARVARTAMREGRIDRMLAWLNTGRFRKPEVPADVVARLREAKSDGQKRQVVEIFGEVRAGAAEREAQKAEWRKKLTPEVLAKADPKAGRAIFDRTCGACHRLFGEGGQVGPELTGGDRQNLSHWLDNVLDPNALIGQGYELHELTKKDGSAVTGMLAGENKREYILKMVGIETRVPKAEVANDKALGISMMPEGLFASMSDAEVANLIKYLSAPAQVEK